MTAIIKSSGIVIRKKKFRETSKLITIFSKDQGKIDLIAKGVRTQKSKLSAVLEPLNYIDFVYYYKDERDIQFLSSAEFIDEFHNIKNDFSKLQYALASLELINFFIHPNHSNPEMFNLLVKTLSELNTNDKSEILIFNYFLLQTLKINGYSIYSTKCPVCNKNLEELKNLFYSKNYGVICQDCSHIISPNKHLDTEFILFYKSATNLELNQISNYKFDPIKQKLMLNQLLEFLSNHIPEFSGLNSIAL